MQWLETLGPIETDNKRLSMSFTQADQTYTLQGMRLLELTPINDKELLHMLGMGFFVHMVTDDFPTQATELPHDLSDLLTEFTHVLKSPPGCHSSAAMTIGFL